MIINEKEYTQAIIVLLELAKRVSLTAQVRADNAHIHFAKARDEYERLAVNLTRLKAAAESLSCAPAEIQKPIIDAIQDAYRYRDAAHETLKSAFKTYSPLNHEYTSTRDVVLALELILKRYHSTEEKKEGNHG